jgi:DNA transformation protein and related proteins
MESDDLIDLFAAFGRVSVRRMFGGFGIYADGLMFALASRGVVYLKADDETAAAFEQEGAGPFTYDTRHGRHASLSYWRLPDRLYDDPDELAAWARTALAVARRRRKPKAVRRPASRLRERLPDRSRR